jgi:hypothetical protein
VTEFDLLVAGWHTLRSTLQVGIKGKGQKLRRIRSKLVGLAVAVAVAVGLLGGAVLAAQPAGATTLNARLAFLCFPNRLNALINGGNLTVDRLPVALDGRYTVWVPEIYRWNGKRWYLYRNGIQQGFYDTVFGQLADNNENFWVPAHSYYMVLDLYVSRGDTRVQAAWATGYTITSQGLRHLGSYCST